MDIDFYTLGSDTSYQPDEEIIKDITEVRNQSMDDMLANITAPDIEIAKPKIDILDKDITQSFNERDQVMSKLGLIDEDFNYTDTYTNYVSGGGQPLPGFEHAHEQILYQERIDSRMKEVEEGTLSMDSALLDLYGKDILETMGYNLRSVGWWQQKYRNNDFSNPLQNKVLMQSVLQQAQEMHEVRQMGSYANKNIKDTALGSLVDTKLSGEKVRQLFAGIDEVAKHMDNSQLMRMVHSGHIDAQMRLTQKEDGSWMYLHTDGILYELDNDKKGAAKYKLDDNGVPKEITFQNQTFTIGRSFVSGFSNSLLGLVNLGALTLDTVSLLWGDEDFSLSTGLTSWSNTRAKYLFTSGRIDLDGFQWDDGADWLNMLASLAGSAAGAKFSAQTVSPMFNHLSSGLIEQGGILSAGGHTVKFLQDLNVYQTGKFGLSHAGANNFWMNRASMYGASGVKSMLGSVQRMYIQRSMIEDPESISDFDIWQKAAVVHGTNFAINMALSSSSGSNLVQGYKQTFEKYRGGLPAEAIAEMHEKAPGIMSHLTGPQWSIRLNTTAEFLNAYITGSIASQATINKETGRFVETDFSDMFKFNAELLASSAINAYQYTYRPQKYEYNLALDHIRSIHTTILDDIDQKIAKTSDEKAIQTLVNFKSQYLSNFNNVDSELVEGHIVQALEQVYVNNPEYIETITTKALNPKKIEEYRRIYDIAEEAYNLREDRVKEFYSSLISDGSKKGVFRRLLRKAITPEYAEYSKRLSRGQDHATQEAFLLNKAHNQYKQFETLLFGNKVVEAMDTIDKTQSEELPVDGVLDMHYGTQLIGKDNKPVNARAERILENVQDMDIKNMAFFTVSNDKQNDPLFEPMKAAYEAASEGENPRVFLVDKETNTYATVVDGIEKETDLVVKATEMHYLIKGYSALGSSAPQAEKADIIEGMVSIIARGQTDPKELTLEAVKVLSKASSGMTVKEKSELIHTLAAKNKIDLQDLGKGTSHRKDINLYRSVDKLLKVVELKNTPEKLKTVEYWDDPGMKDAANILASEGHLNPNLAKEIRNIMTEVVESTNVNFQSSDTVLKREFHSYLNYASTLSQLSKKDRQEMEKVIGDNEYSELFRDFIYSEDEDEYREEFERRVTDLFKYSKTESFNGDTIILDLPSLMSKESVKHVQQIISRDMADKQAIKGAHDLSSYDYDRVRLNKETTFLNDLIARSGSNGMLSFNLNSREDVEELNRILVGLGHIQKTRGLDFEGHGNKEILRSITAPGIFYRDGDYETVTPKDYDKDKTIQNVQKVLAEGRVTIDGKTTNLYEVEYLNPNGIKMEATDKDGNFINLIDKTYHIINKHDLVNIDPKLRVGLKDSSLLNVLPFAPKDKYTPNSLGYAIMKYGSIFKLKTGTTGGKAAKTAGEFAIATVVDQVDRDKNLSAFSINQQIVESIADQGDVTLRYAEIDTKTLRKAVEMGLISDKHNPNNGAFWKVASNTNYTFGQQNNVVITFDENKVEEFKQYVYAEDFNMYKVLPFLKGFHTKTGDQVLMPYTSNEARNTDEKYGDLKTIYAIENLDIPWDTVKNEFKAEFFKGLIDNMTGEAVQEAIENGEVPFYSNFEDGKNIYTESLEDIEFETLEEFSEYIQKHKNTNPNAKLISLYNEAFEKTAYAEEGIKTEDWRVITKMRNVVDLALEHSEITPEVIKQIQGEVQKLTSTPMYKFSGDASSGSRFFIPTAGGYNPGKLPLSATTLMSTYGGIENMSVNVDGEVGWVPSEEVVKEFHAQIQLDSASLDETFMYPTTDNLTSRYIQTGKTRLLSLLSRGQGTIHVDDADEALELLGQEQTFAQQLMGEQEYKAMVSQLEKFTEGMAKAIGETTIKPYTERRQDSREAPTLIRTPFYSISREGGYNVNKQKELIDNYLAYQDNKENAPYAKLMDKALKEGEHYAFTKDLINWQEEELLYNQDNPSNAIKRNISTITGLALEEKNTVNTSLELEATLRDRGVTITPEIQEKILESALTINNHSHGTDYISERVKYMFLRDDGSLEGINAVSTGVGERENMMDLIKAFNTNKETLIGTTLLSLERQGVDNTSGAKFGSIYLDEANYTKMGTLLMHYMHQDNERYFRDFAQDPTLDLSSIIQTMSDEDYRTVVNNIARSRVTTRDFLEDNFLRMKKSSGGSLTRKQFYKAVKTGNRRLEGGFVGNFKDIAIANFVSEKTGGDIVTAYNSSDPRQRDQVDAMLYRITPESLTRRQEEFLSMAQAVLKHDITSNKFIEYDTPKDLVEAAPDIVHEPTYATGEKMSRYFNEFNTDSEFEKEFKYEFDKEFGEDIHERDKALVKAITQMFGYSRKGEHLNLVFNNTSLKAMKRIRENGFKNATIQTGHERKGNLNRILETVKSIKGIDNSTTDVDRFITFDIETSNKDFNKANKDYAFSVGFVVHKKETGKDGKVSWNQEKKLYYFDHGDVEEWLKNNITSDENTSGGRFHNKEQGYRDELKFYGRMESGKSYTSTRDDGTVVRFDTVDNLKEEFKLLLGNDTIMAGFNSDKSDMPALKNAEFFTDDILEGVEMLDALVMANVSELSDTTSSMQLSDLYELLFNEPYRGEAHGALVDAEITWEIMQDILENQKDISQLTTVGIHNINNVLESLGVEVDSESYNKIIRDVDYNLEKMKEKMSDTYKEYNIRPFKFSADAVTDLKRVFEIYAAKELKKAVWELNEQRVLDSGLSDEALSILSNPDVSDRLRSVITYLDIKTGKGLDKIVTEVKNAAKVGEEEMFTSDEALRLLGTEIGNIDLIEHMNSAFKLEDKMTFTEMKEMIEAGKNSPEFFERKKQLHEGLKEQYDEDGSILSNEARTKLQDYNDLRNSNGITYASQNLFKNSGLDEIGLLDHFIEEIWHTYDFSENADVDKLLAKYSPNKVSTPFSRGYTEYLNRHFGNVDALVNVKVDGSYQNISSFNIGDRHLDLLTGKQAVLGSGDVLITKQTFLTLMRANDIEHVKAEMKKNGLTSLYTTLLLNPAVTTGYMPVKKLVVIDHRSDSLDKDFYMAVPESVMEVMNSRDMDGDKTTLVKPNMNSVNQRYMAHINDIMYQAHDFQEGLLSLFKKEMAAGTLSSQENKDIYRNIYFNKDVHPLMDRLDDILEKNNGDGNKAKSTKEYQQLREEFNDVMFNAGMLQGHDDEIARLDELWEVVDYVEGDYRAAGKDLHLWYSNNPYTNKNGISAQNRFKRDVGLTVFSPKYYMGDSKTGMEHKAMTMGDSDEINDPLVKLAINSVFTSDVVTPYLEGLDNKDAQKVMDNLKQTFDNLIKKNQNMLLYDRATITNNNRSIWEAFAGKDSAIDRAFKAYKAGEDVHIGSIIRNDLFNLMVGFESFILNNASHNENVKAALREVIENGDNFFERELAVKEKGLELYNQSVQDKQLYGWEGSHNMFDAGTYLLNQELQDGEFTSNKISYTQELENIYGEKDKVNLFISYGSPFAEDIAVANTKSKTPMNAMILDEITFGPKDRLYQHEYKDKRGNRHIRDFKEGDRVKAGTFITNSQQALYDSEIIHIDKKKGEIKLLNKEPLSNTSKIITDAGSKSMLDFAELSDENVDFVISQDRLKADRTLHTSYLEAKKTEKTITMVDSSGNTREIKGYVVKGAVPNMVEQIYNWRKSGTYNSGHMNLISVGKDIYGPSFLGKAAYSIDKKGDLIYDPSRIEKLRAGLEHPERDIVVSNRAGAVQSLRMAMLINNMTDEEIQQEFGVSKYRILNNKYRDKNAVTRQYNSEIKSLYNKYYKGTKREDNLKNTSALFSKLFDPQFDSLLGNFEQSRLRETHPDKASAKGESGVASSSRSDDGRSTVEQVQGSMYVATQGDQEDRSKISLEEIYIPAMALHRYLFDMNLTKEAYIELTKAGLLKHGRVANETSIDSEYRRKSLDYIVDGGPMAMNINRLNVNPESGYTQDPYINVPLTDMEVPVSFQGNNDMLLPERGMTHNVLTKAIARNIKEEGWEGYNNDARVWEMILGLNNASPYMNKFDRANKITNGRGGKDYTMSLHKPVYKADEEGNMYYSLSHLGEVTDKAEKHISNVNRAMRNYNYFNLAVNDLYEMVDEKDIGELKTNIGEDIHKRQELRKSDYSKVDEAFDTLIESIVDRDTGVVKEDINILDYEIRAMKEENKPSRTAPKLSYEKNSDPILETSLWSRKGAKIDTEEGFAYDVAMRNHESKSTFDRVQLQQSLHSIRDAKNKVHMPDEDFEKFVMLSQLQATEDLAARTKQYGSLEAKTEWLKNNGVDLSARKEDLQHLKIKYSGVAMAYENYIDELLHVAKRAENATGDPFGNLMVLFSPFSPSNKSMSDKKVVSTIATVANLNYREHASERNMIKSNMMFDFFGSGERMIRELTTLANLDIVSDTLIEKGFISNEKIIENVNSLIKNRFDVDKYTEGNWSQKAFRSEGQYREIQEHVLDMVGLFTKLDVEGLKRNNPKIDLLYKNTYEQLDMEVDVLTDTFNQQNGTDLQTYIDFKKLAENQDADPQQKREAEVVSNYMYAKMVVVQGMLESSSSMTDELSHFISALGKDGYSFVNKFGQRYEKGGVVKPLSGGSLAHLPENIEIAENSWNDTVWNQHLLQKMLSGEIYLMKNENADFMEKNHYTYEMPSKTMQTLKNVSRMSTGLAMVNPARMASRVMSFLGYDYSVGSTYSYKTIGNMGQARKEIIAAYMSNGKNMSPELQEYMEKEGQPVGLSDKDPITFQEDMTGAASNVISKATLPLAIENHLGRYAIYLTAKKSFDEGNPWYGPMYHMKDNIDSLENNSDKAMLIVDYMLGAPGGFPNMSRKLSGLMMYTTFPLTHTRRLGAYGMTLSKLSKEGFTSENAPHWMRSVVNPAIGVAGLTALGTLLVSWMSDMFGVDEETEEEWKKNKVNFDPIGTLLTGSPTTTSTKTNPLAVTQDLFISPFTDKRNDTLGKKLFGGVNQHVLAHLNPAIKIPTEVLTGYDLFGNSPFNTKSYYNWYENAIRKTAGLFLGTGIANSAVNQFQIDKYGENTSFVDSLAKGITRGVSNDLGNQRSYKKDLKNYYGALNSVRNYRSAMNPYQDADVADLMDAEYLAGKRYSGGAYGTFDKAEYQRINNLMKTMIRNQVPESQVYALITDEYNNGVSEATLRSVLNNNSLQRRLKQVNMSEYMSTLSSKERLKIQNALAYESEAYPLLDDFFPENKKGLKNMKKPYYNRIYNGGSTGAKAPYIPRTYLPKIYPNNYSYKKQNNYRNKPRMDRAQVNVSPQMAIWNKDYNLTPYDPTFPFLKTYNQKKKGGPKWLR